MKNETEHTALVDAVRKDILSIGHIYPTLGQALYDEPVTRLALRIVSTVGRMGREAEEPPPAVATCPACGETREMVRTIVPCGVHRWFVWLDCACGHECCIREGSRWGDDIREWDYKAEYGADETSDEAGKGKAKS